MPPAATRSAPRPDSAPSALDRRAHWALGVGALVLAALGLRLWGIGHGLPFVYNVDEAGHFVPRAIGFFGHDLDPRYFVNPPAFTYLLHVVFAVWFGGGEGVGRAHAADAADVFLVARAVSAALGAIAVGLLAVAGARLFGDRRVGLLAAALLAVAFLPVFYGHLALNDGPALAPVALALLGAAGILRGGGARAYALAAIGVGLAAATKYTAGIVVLPVLAAIVLAPGASRPARRGWAAAATLALAAVAFVAANPFAVLTPGDFLDGLTRQAGATRVPKLGASDGSGHVHYLWSLTWGFGWLPAAAALAGAIHLAVRRRAPAAVLVPAPIVFLLFMGAQERFFGRWVMPILPILCLLAAAAAVAAADALGRHRPALRPLALSIAAAALLGQGVLAAVHIDRVLSRPDTRADTRAWLARNLPAGTKVVVEPATADGWLPAGLVDVEERRRLDPPAGAVARRRVAGRPLRRIRHSPGVVGGEGYGRMLHPALLDAYRREGACHVVTASTQSGRVFADPDRVPAAVAYYAALRRQSDVVHRASPWAPGADPVPFSFDHSFTHYPAAYARPGPEITVHRLHACPGS